MPEQNGKVERVIPPALPDPATEKVKLPPTEAERRKLRLERALKESDDERSARHAKELATHLEVHMADVREAHEMYPDAPMTRDVENWTEAQANAWNERSKTIASAKRAYHLAVARQFADHQEEHRHVRQFHDERAKKAQETV